MDNLNSTQNTKINFLYYLKIIFKNGIGVYFISLILSLLTFFYIVFPIIWSYKIKKITHKFIGTIHFGEQGNFGEKPIGISNLRLNKVFFISGIYTYFFIIFTNLIFLNSNLFHWFLFIIGFISILSYFPIIGNTSIEDLILKSTHNSIMTFVSIILILMALIFSLIIENILTLLLVTILITLILFIIIYLKKKI